MLEIESPLIAEMEANAERRARQKDILAILEDRFGPIPSDLGAEIRTIADDSKLHQLHLFAFKCPDLDAFRSALRA